jgi:hypothetical protein
VLGLSLSTFGRTVVAGVVIALAWLGAVLVFDLPLSTDFGYSLGIVIGFTVIAVIAHAVRRLVGAGWRSVRR